MKKYIWVIILINYNLYSQISVDAGDNLYLCSTIDTFELAPINQNRGSFNLGLNSKILNSKGKLNYKWSCKVKTELTSAPFIYASELLNDTSILNPFLKNRLVGILSNKRVILYLKITDSLNNSASDSIEVIQSGFIYTMSSDMAKLVKDTAWLESNIRHGVPPLKFIWSPSLYLIDSTISPTKTYTPYNQTYYSTATDSLGCKTGDQIRVSVFTNSIYENNKYSLSIHPNPTQDKLFISTSTTSSLKYSIYNLLGQEIIKGITKSKIDVNQLNNGIYYIHLNNDKLSKSFQFEVHK